MEIGSYAHRAILHEPDEIPSIEAAKLSPTEMPFTDDDFDPQLEQALELMPDVLSNPDVEIRYAINGLLSLTPDGAPILGESPEVKGLWSAAAVWVKEGPGVGRAVAEWMTNGLPSIDVQGADIARFHPHQRTREHVRARTSEAFIKTYGIVHPGEQWNSDRNVRLSPMHEREKELGAVFFEVAGWERPQWYESNAKLLEEFGERVMDRSAEWDSRWWSPIINAEHLALRERAGLVDLSSFVIFDVFGPAALDAVQSIVLAQMDVSIGRVVYTPVLDEAGGFRSDLTIMRLAHDRFRVVTGAAHGMVDVKWFSDRLPVTGAQIADLTSSWTTIGLWGPRARDILSQVTSADVSHEGFKFGTARTIESRLSDGPGLPHLLRRRSGLGALRPHGIRAEALGRPHRGRPRAWARTGGTRRLRHDGAHREGLPRLRCRTRLRTQRHRGRHGPTEGEVTELRRPRCPPATPQGGPESRPLLTHGRRSYEHQRRETLHARRGTHPIQGRRPARRRAWAPLLRHLGGVGSEPGQACPDGVPSSRRGGPGQPAHRRLHGGVLPGDGGLDRRHSPLRSQATRASGGRR